MSGLAAALAAALAALVPAHQHRSQYLWPATGPSSAAPPARMWITPLLLERHHAAAIVVRLGCDLPPPLAGGGGRLVLQTTRKRTNGGLSLRLRGGRLDLSVGRGSFARLPLPPPARGCPTTLTVVGRRWTFTAADGRRLAGRSFHRAPNVTGLLSGRDVSRPGLAVSVTTEVERASATAVQKALDAFAVVLALLALGLAAPVRRGALRRPGAPRPRLADAAVVAFLLVWWVVAPSFYDDGWVRARQLNYAVSGVFSNYFDTWGAQLPLVHWLDWLQHWPGLASGSALVLRIVPLSAGLLAWLVCRDALRRATGGELERNRVLEWSAAAVFLAAFVAWGMTLRPEPVVALLFVASLDAMLRFVESPSLAPLAVVALILPLALTAHPAGVVVLAPLLAAGPSVVRWYRTAGRAEALAGRLAALALAAGALVLLLVFVGTDLATWRGQQALFRAHEGQQMGWRNELSRYAALDNPGYGTPARRLSVGLLFLSVLAFATRRGAGRRPAYDLPALSVVLGLGLLVATPSKWPWHFGVLIGVGAVAFGAELARFVADGRLSGFGLSLRPAVTVALVVGLVGWAWAVNPSWALLDLHTLGWSTLVQGGRHLSPASTKQWLVLVCLGGAVVAGGQRWRGRSWRPGRALWLVATPLAGLVAASVVLVTAGMFIRDTQDTHGWTLTRQNLDDLRGIATCGLADGLAVPRPGSIAPLPALGAAPGGRAQSGFGRDDVWPPAARPPFGRPPVWGSGRTPGTTQVRWSSPWFAAPSRGPEHVGVFVAGRLGPRGRLVVTWGRREGGRVVRLRSGRVGVPAPPPGQVWRLVPDRRLPARPRAANALLIDVAQGTRPPQDWLGVSAPVRYEEMSIASVARETPRRLLVVPVLGLYVPCLAAVPRLVHGIAEPPSIVVAQTPAQDGWPLVDSSSPFSGVLDLTGAFRLPLASSWPSTVAVLVAPPLPPGWRAAPLRRRDLVS